MPRLTITITDEQSNLLNEKTGDNGEYESKSEAVRDFIQRYDDLEERERERQREHARELAELERRIRDLETENKRLHRERRQLLEQREENTELVKAVKEERTLARKKAEAGLWTKTKWALFGMSDDETKTDD